MLKRKLKYISIALILFSFSANAQKEVEVQAVKNVITEFTKAAINLRTKGHSERDAALKYVSSNFILSGTNINIKNVISTFRWNYKEILAVSAQMRRTTLSLKRTIRDLNDVFVRENLAFVRYVNDYEWIEGDRMISKGTQFVNVILKKYPEKGWLIESFSVINTDDETYKGMCVSTVYEEKNRKDFLAQTLVPDGTYMDEYEDNFTIFSDVEPKIIHSGFKDYMWTNKGVVTKKNRDGTAGDHVGNAKTTNEVIILLLNKEIYPDRCFQVVPLLK